MRVARAVSWSWLLSVMMSLSAVHADPVPRDGVGSPTPASAVPDTSHRSAATSGFASLFVRATDHAEPLAFGMVHFQGAKLGGMVGENGTVRIERIPAGRWVTIWRTIGFESVTDTLTFTAGREETLWVRDPRGTEPGWIVDSFPVYVPASLVPQGHPLRKHLGVLWTRGDTCLFASEADSLAPGERVSALLMDPSGRVRSLRVAAKIGTLSEIWPRAVLIERSRPLWVYRLDWADSPPVHDQVGLGVVDLRSRVRRIGTRLAVDLDDDGTIELVASCVDSDRLNLFVRSQRTLKPLWSACYPYAHDVEPNCSDQDGW